MMSLIYYIVNDAVHNGNDSKYVPIKEPLCAEGQRKSHVNYELDAI